MHNLTIFIGGKRTIEAVMNNLKKIHSKKFGYLTLADPGKITKIFHTHFFLVIVQTFDSDK